MEPQVEILTYTNPFTQKSAHQNSHLVHASLASPADGIGPGLTAGMELLGSNGGATNVAQLLDTMNVSLKIGLWSAWSLRSAC